MSRQKAKAAGWDAAKEAESSSAAAEGLNAVLSQEDSGLALVNEAACEDIIQDDNPELSEQEGKQEAASAPELSSGDEVEKLALQDPADDEKADQKLAEEVVEAANEPADEEAANEPADAEPASSEEAPESEVLGIGTDGREHHFSDKAFNEPLELAPEQRRKLDRAQEIIGYRFKQERYLLSAITHPSATEGKSVKCSYERFEFLGDSILGAIVATIAFEKYHDLDEGGLTRVKVALVSGSSLSDLSQRLGFSDVIVFGSSEAGTGRRGLHSALENVYEAIVAALFLDGGICEATKFVNQTLIPQMSPNLAKEPENPKSALQEKLQEDGITPTYKLVETQGPPHDRRFVAQVYAGSQGLARGTGRTKKEAESQAAKSTLARLGEFFGIGLTDEEREQKAAAEAKAKAEKAQAVKQAKADKAAAAEKARADKAAAAEKLKADKAAAKARKQQERESAKNRQ